MISFTCGTYHGLFVDTGVPSVLPKDISYFDFRTRGGRAIPSDDAPNLVVRYNGNAEQGNPSMMMVALCYRAIEGNREGFIAFGSLLFEPFSSRKIDEGIQAAIKVARNSSDFFNGKIISNRPTSKEGRPLDLTTLPLFESGEFFGELNANINNGETIKNVSTFAQDLVSSGIDHYEIVINPRRGMNQNDLLNHFNHLVSRQKKRIDELQERAKRLQDRKRQEESLQAQSEVDRRKRNTFLLQVLAFGISGAALIGLVILVVLKYWVPGNQVADTQTTDTEISQLNTDPTSEIGDANGTVSSTQLENMEVENCNLETLSSDDLSKDMIITDLPTDDKCISISDGVTSVFDSQSLDLIITSSNSDFTVSEELPDLNQRFLTSFGRIVDSEAANGLGIKYSDEGKNFVLPDPSLSFSIAMETVSPSMICSADVSERDALSDEFPKFEYYTSSQNDYREAIRWFSEGVLLRLGLAFRQIGEEMKSDDPSNPEVTSAANRLRDFGRNLSNLAKSDDLILWTGALGQDQNTCVILITQEDEISFYSALEVQGQMLPYYSMEDFLKSHALVEEKYNALVKEKSQTDCHKIPGLFMVWKSDRTSAMIMENAIGFNPYTEKDGQDFDYTLKLAKTYGSPVYKLPAVNKFDDLKEYFASDPDFSPFSPELYTRENFCFPSNPAGQ